MFAPRSFQYSSLPPKGMLNEKSGSRDASRRGVPSKPERALGLKPSSPARTTTASVRVPSPPISVPKPKRAPAADVQSMPSGKRDIRSDGSRKHSAHDSNALPPAVAALLAITEIPRPKPSQFRRRQSNTRQISIDELVNDWKNDETLHASYSSSPALSVLLKDADNEGKALVCDTGEDSVLYTRSTSLESVPSLEADAKSFVSRGSPSTPESLRSRESTTNLKKERARSLPPAQECITSHPLVESSVEDHDEDPEENLILLRPEISRQATPKPKSRFTSNLTTSLQALKSAALNSISSFTSGNASPQTQRAASSILSDDMLWSHPFLFPRLSSEMRPAIEGMPTEAQRRYLNPMPLTFEEQEAPYQLALHAPYLAEAVEGAAKIQMQTYSRSRRKSASKRAIPDPQSEAGRALLGAGGMRQREPRENSDFLRVVVMEMNMRRSGKLETGKARIWLPPRQVSPGMERRDRVPKRWEGESAY